MHQKLWKVDEGLYWSDEVKKCLKLVVSISNMLLQHAARSNYDFAAVAHRYLKAEIWAVKKGT